MLPNLTQPRRGRGRPPEAPGIPALPPSWPAIPKSGQGQKEGACGSSPEEEAERREKRAVSHRPCRHLLPQLAAHPAAAAGFAGAGSPAWPGAPGQGHRRCGGSVVAADALGRRKRFTFVLAVVIGVFVLCWFPFFFSYSLGAICPLHCRCPRPLQFFFWIGYCNSSLNPVIYTIFSRTFAVPSGGSCAASGPRRPGEPTPACCPCGVATSLGFLVPSWS